MKKLQAVALSLLLSAAGGGAPSLIDAVKSGQKAVLRSLLAKPRNPLKSAQLAPTGSSFFFGWDNLKVLWDAVVEAVWPDPAQYAAIRRTDQRIGDPSLVA